MTSKLPSKDREGETERCKSNCVLEGVGDGGGGGGGGGCKVKIWRNDCTEVCKWQHTTA